MKTMTALWTGSEIARIILMWITIIIIAPSYCQDIPKIKNIDCLNDFDTKMVCFWEVENGGTNCSSDFQLKYTDVLKTMAYCQDLDNEYHENFRIPSKCICNITVKEGFIREESYLIEVISQGQSVGQANIDIGSSVKPKPPSNLRVDVTKPENGAVHWETNYNLSYIRDKLSFYIQFISKEDDKMVIEQELPQLESQYPFNKRKLTRGHDYRVRVRTKLRNDEKTKEIWSEWSLEVVFRNDYHLTIMDWMWLIIPVSCIVILLLTVFCYCCITRTKENWWNNLPDPAKSKLVGSELIQKNHLNPAGKSSAGKSRDHCVSQLVKAQKRSTYERFTMEHLLNDCPNLMGNNTKAIIFEPEKVNIESCIQLYPRKNENLHEEDSPEDTEEDFHLMTLDWSIDKMFSDILSDSPVKMEAQERLNVDNTCESFGSLILRNNFQKTERHLPLSMVSQESGYQSYESDESPGDSKLDGLNPLYFDHSPVNQGDSFPYAPVSSIKESGSEIGKEDTFMNSGYNSFANALAEAASDVMEGDNVSVFSLDLIFCNPYYHQSLQNPKSILYHNQRCFTTHCEDDLGPTITPTSDLRAETCPTFVTEVPGYQSFNQAVQQGDTPRSPAALIFDSGYKLFESPTIISTNGLDNISGWSERDNHCPYKDSVHSNEDVPWTGIVNDGTDTQSSGYHITEVNFYDRKYPSYSETLGDERKDLLNQDLDSDYSIARTSQEADKPLALTFDISDHLRNFANIQGPKRSLGLELVGFPTNLVSFACSRGEATIICDDLLDKGCLHTDKNFPMKFENMSYFVPICHLRTGGYNQTNSHLLAQQNNMDEEGNSYMKITLW